MNIRLEWWLIREAAEAAFAAIAVLCSLTIAAEQSHARVGAHSQRDHPAVSGSTNLGTPTATQLLRLACNPKVASERLGHLTVGITLALYSHVLPGMQENAAAKVGDALRAAINKCV